MDTTSGRKNGWRFQIETKLDPRQRIKCPFIDAPLMLLVRACRLPCSPLWLIVIFSFIRFVTGLDSPGVSAGGSRSRPIPRSKKKKRKTKQANQVVLYHFSSFFSIFPPFPSRLFRCPPGRRRCRPPLTCRCRCGRGAPTDESA